MDDVRSGLLDPLRYMAHAAEVTPSKMPRKGIFRNAKSKVVSERGEHFIGARAAGGAVRNQPNLMAARGLSAGKINDVAKKPANRCAKDMQNG